MGLILLALIVVFLFVGLGFLIHLLWIVAVIAAIMWLIGWLFRAAEGDSRRHWYGRY